MQTTFNETAKPEAARIAENEKRAAAGEPQIPGAAGRESIPDKSVERESAAS
jgi:hypothetical protein